MCLENNNSPLPKKQVEFASAIPSVARVKIVPGWIDIYIKKNKEKKKSILAV